MFCFFQINWLVGMCLESKELCFPTLQSPFTSIPLLQDHFFILLICFVQWLVGFRYVAAWVFALGNSLRQKRRVDSPFRIKKQLLWCPLISLILRISIRVGSFLNKQFVKPQKFQICHLTRSIRTQCSMGFFSLFLAYLMIFQSGACARNCKNPSNMPKIWPKN